MGGLTHSAYLLKDVLCWAANIDTSKGDPRKVMDKNFLYYARCFLSVFAVSFCGTFLFKGWFLKQTGATHGVGWEDLPGWAAILVSVFFLFIMACAEGIQVSALALQRTPTETFRESKPNVYRILKLLGGSDGVEYEGRNMKAFLVGRQFFVAMMVCFWAASRPTADLWVCLSPAPTGGWARASTSGSCRLASAAPFSSSTLPSWPRRSPRRS